MIGGISQLLAFLINSMVDIKDAMTSDKPNNNLTGNVLELVAVCTDDLPKDFVEKYCESLQVVYATLIRGILQSSIRSRFTLNPESIFKSIPLLSNADKVTKDKLGAFHSVTSSLFGNKGEKMKGGDLANAFLENMKIEIREAKKAIDGQEADIFLNDTRTALPKYVDVIVPVSTPSGNIKDVVVPIGVMVKVKYVSPEEMVQFFIKRRNLAEGNQAKAKLNFFKSLISKKKIKEEMDIPEKDKHLLYAMLESVKDVKKPFINLVFSNFVENSLKNAGINIEDRNVIRNLVTQLPIMSLCSYNMGTDTLKYTLNNAQHTLLTSKASSFNSDISNLQKNLSEGLRLSKLLA